MRFRRVELLLFVLAWLSYAFFHQGGGWNQNGRFALTRALVESRRPWIDDYLVYAPRGSPGSSGLRRIPVRNGCFEAEGRTFALGWYVGDGPLAPLAPDAPRSASLIPVDSTAVTGDLAYARGHVHPNKAPGASLAAVPGYTAIWAVERVAGIDLDDAWVMTVNAWLTGALSVGLIAALGVVLFWRLALRVSGGRARAALFATIALAFGSLYFPYATMLYDHDLVAVALFAGFWLALDAKSKRNFALSGLCAGAAIVASYLSVIAATILGAYVLFRSGRRAAVAFALGTVPPLLLLGTYNVACFGTPFTTNYAWQNPLFKDAQGSLLGVFTAPDAGVLAMLLVSPLRGLFAITPVLILGVIGLVAMVRSQQFRPEGILCVAMIAHVLAFNVTFEAWHGGWACGPRYLVPALPFLALPIVLAGTRAAWLRRALAAVSIVAMALVSAVDAQPPWVDTGDPPTGPAATVSPVWSIDLPQFVYARPGGYASAAWPETFRERYIQPVGANPVGVFEGLPFRFFAAGSAQSLANSFNAGEALLPGRRASLLVWLLATAVLAYLVRRELARGDQDPV